VSAEVHAVVLSWNSARFLPDCLDSLAAQTHRELAVTVIDNGSTDGSADLVADRAPRVDLLRLESNLGFCRANNLAVGRRRSPFLLFLNADVILDPGFVSEALPGFGRDPRVGMVSGRILRFDRKTVDSAGQFLARSRRTLERGYGEPDGAPYRREGEVFSVCGAAAFYRREMVEDIAPRGELFDPSFFAFHEDLDVGWRAQARGWKAWYRPGAVVYHYRGGTGREEGFLARRFQTARRPPEVVRHIVLNRWLSILKNDRSLHVLRDAPAILLRDLFTLGALALFSPRALLAVLRSGPELRAALARRRDERRRDGRWGAFRPGLSRPGIWKGTGAPAPPEERT
jgi:GT2 family glycosyltransferase